MNLELILNVINKLDDVAIRLLEFKGIFSKLDLKDHRKQEEQISQELNIRRIDCTYNMVQMKLILVDNYLDYFNLPKKPKQHVNSSFKLPSTTEMISQAHQHSMEGWMLLQRQAALFCILYGVNGSTCKTLSDKFALQQLDLLLLFKSRFNNSNDVVSSAEAKEFLKIASRTNELALCDEHYEKAISLSDHPNLIFNWRWEQTHSLVQHVYRIITKEKLTSSKLESLNPWLQKIIAGYKFITEEVNRGIKEIQAHYMPLLSNDINTLLFFLGYTYHQTIQSHNRAIRQKWLDLTKELISVNLAIAIENYNYLQAPITYHVALNNDYEATLQAEINQIIVNAAQEKEQEEINSQILEEYNLHFTEVLAEFGIDAEPPRKKLSSGKSRSSANQEADSEVDNSFDPDEPLENAEWLKLHVVKFFDKPGKSKTLLNGQSLSNGRHKAYEEKNALDMIKYNFGLSDFYRLKALRMSSNGFKHLSSVLEYIDTANQYWGYALPLMETELSARPNRNYKAKLVKIQKWAEEVLTLTESQLVSLSEKIHKKLEFLKISRAQALARITAEHGDNGWFKNIPFNWDNLSKKTQQHQTLCHEFKMLQEIESAFKDVKKCFLSQKDKLEKQTAEVPINQTESLTESQTSTFFKQAGKGNKKPVTSTSSQKTTAPS